MLSTINATELAAGDLIAKDYTALLNPNQSIPAGAGATALQAFVNQGGTYVGTLANGTTAARNAGITTLNTVTLREPQRARPAFSTPGSTFTGVVRHGEPGGVGLRRRRVHLPRRDGATRSTTRGDDGTADARAGGALRQSAQEPRLLALGDRARASSTGARTWSTIRSARAGRS